MGKVTYYIGAGASHGALPIVNEMHDQFMQLFSMFQAHKPAYPDLSWNNGPYTCKIMKEIVLNDLGKLTDYLNNNGHITIDEYAERLYATQKFEELDRVKILLSFLLINKQIGKKVDYRYELFLTSISNPHIGSFKEVRIVTWNYDYQFEIAYSILQQNPPDDSIISIQKSLHCKPYRFHDPDPSPDCFSIFKLNGSTAFNKSNPLDLTGHPLDFEHPLDNLATGLFDELFEKLLYYYFVTFYNPNGPKIQPLLQFAWQRNQFSDPVILGASKSIKDSKALVVIGYSFPFVNREIDSIILSGIDEKCVIFVQDLDCDPVIERLKERLPENFNNKIVSVPIKDPSRSKFHPAPQI